MGLTERRLAEELKNKVPQTVSKIKDLAGYDINLDIDWETFVAFDAYPINRLEKYLSEVEAFVKNICSDEMGKMALKEKLETIKIINSDKDNTAKMDLKDKVLSLHVQFAGDSYSYFGSSHITPYMLNLL